MNIEEVRNNAFDEGKIEGLKEAIKFVEEYIELTEFNHHQYNTNHTVYSAKLVTAQAIRILLEERMDTK